MLKNFYNFILIILSVIFISLSASANENKYYEFVPIKDSKTKTEFARVLVPEKFDIKSDIFWSQDKETPFFLQITSVSPDKDVEFLYNSPQLFSDSRNVLSSENMIDTFLKVRKRIYIEPEEYFVNLIKKENPSADDIILVSEYNCEKTLEDYLVTEMYKKMEEMRLNAKTDIRFSKINVFAPILRPCLKTYSYKVNNKIFKQTFLTVFTSYNYSFTKKTNYDVYETQDRKIWCVKDLYSYKAESDIYDKNYDDFIVFVMNLRMNKNAVSAIDAVKLQMNMELNPLFIDVHTNKNLRNLSLDLFLRYYDFGQTNYKEDKDSPVQKPSIEHSAWIIGLQNPLNVFCFNNVKFLKNQKIYFPDKYKSIYYNEDNQVLIISEEKQIPLKRKYKQAQEI